MCGSLCVGTLIGQTRSLGTEVTSGCEPLDVGAGNRTWAPWENSTRFCRLSPFCFPLSWESLRLRVFGGPLWNRKVHPKTTRSEGSCEFAVLWKDAGFWRGRNWVFLPLCLNQSEEFSFTEAERGISNSPFWRSRDNFCSHEITLKRDSATFLFKLCN